MKWMTLTCITAFLVALVFFGATRSRPAAAADCSSAQTQMAINLCENLAAKAADASLLTAYATAVHALPQARRAQLASAQSAWRQYRAKECAFEAGAYAGGSLMPSAADACYAAITKARTAQLKTLVAQLKSG